MDHLLENESKPIPDLSSVSASGASGTVPRARGDVPMDEDDEDTAALAAVYGGGNASVTPAAADVEAKVLLLFVVSKSMTPSLNPL